MVSTSFSAQESASPDTVVLLHGLGRTAKSMTYIQERLTDAGYHVFNYDYESRKNEIDSLVTDLQQYLETCCSRKESDLHFVLTPWGAFWCGPLLPGKNRKT